MRSAGVLLQSSHGVIWSQNGSTQLTPPRHQEARLSYPVPVTHPLGVGGMPLGEEAPLEGWAEAEPGAAATRAPGTGDRITEEERP